MKATAAALLQPTKPAATRNMAGPIKAEKERCVTYILFESKILHTNQQISNTKSVSTILA